MAFFVGGAVVGIVVAYDDHSNHSNHSNYTRYNDAELVNRIKQLQSQINSRQSDIDRSRNQLQAEYRERINRLKSLKNYPALTRYSAYNVLDFIQSDMEAEINNGIRQEQSELAALDRMIAKINELELDAGRNG